MHALSRQLATTLRLTTHRQPVIARPLHTTTELSRRCRDYFGFRQEEGRWVPKKRSFNGPSGGFQRQKWHRNGTDDGMGKYSAAQKRIQIFQQEPGQTAILEDLPMWWMLDPMSETEKEAMKTEHRIDAWKENMYKRGFELPRRPVDEGPVFRYRTAQQQKVARKKRLQIQYENHFIRLRALSKNNLLPAAMVNEAAEYKWMLQNGRFAELRGFDREARSTVCRLHGRMVSVRPRWGVRRFPMRLLIDYGEGTCGIMRDYHGRRQREYYVDFCRRKQSKRKPRQWHRSETYYRYQYTK